MLLLLLPGSGAFVARRVFFYGQATSGIVGVIHHPTTAFAAVVILGISYVAATSNPLAALAPTLTIAAT